MLLTRLERFDGVALLATNQAHMLDEALSRRILAQVEFSPPTTAARTEIWRKHLPAALPLAPDVDVAHLAESFELSGGLIKNAVLAAVVRAVSRASEQIDQSDLTHGARLQLRTHGGAEQRIESTEVRLADVRLPAEVTARLEALVRAARARSTVLSEWGMGRTLGRGTGLAALFSGPPGTGKSMAAEAVASELARPLLRARLPSLVPSYVGETARNLEKLFERACEHRAVLVFDEADALFGLRVAVRTSTDRLSNGEVGALLSLLERHEGLVLLTSNLPEAIDPAFSRRLHMQVAFPLPDALQRTALWRQFLRSDAPVARDVDPARLGRQYELSGGAIRAAVLLAALEAASEPATSRCITQAMLERAAAEQTGGAPVPLRGVGMA